MKKTFPDHGELDQAGLEALSITQLVELYNKAEPNLAHPIKLFNKKNAAVERVWASYPDPVSATPVADTPTTTEGEIPTTPETEEEMAKKKKAAADKKAAKKAAGGGGRRGNFDPEAKIKLTVAENPKRKGSASAKRFDKYANGMKVSEALEKGVKSADIAWDQKHGYITLSK
jgi:hypothetical protein